MKKITTIVSLLLLSLSATLALADPVWIDVRTAEEHSMDHIQGDMHIPLNAFNADSITEILSKDAEIKLYCRSGNRAGQAMAILEERGFTNVINAGGIDDVRKMRDLPNSEAQ